MSDALLTEISKKLSDIHAALKGGAPAAAPKTTDTTAADKAAADKAKADKAAKAAAAKAAAEKAAAAKAGAAAPAGTKAPNGTHTIEEVRELLRQVATKEGLGKQAALAILDENGGVDHLSKLKPENFDAVFEAAQAELNGGAAGGGEDDDGLGL